MDMFSVSKIAFLIVHKTIFIFLLVGAAVALVAGIMLVFDSRWVFGISDRMNSWVSTRVAMRPLFQYRSVSRPLYRMHRLVGILICAGALYCMAVLGAWYGDAAVMQSLSAARPTRFASWILQSGWIVLLAGNFCALLFGIVFAVRPSALRGIEAWADRQISIRRASKPLEEMRLPADQFTRAHPKLVGSLIVLGSLFVLANMGFAALGWTR